MRKLLPTDQYHRLAVSSFSLFPPGSALLQQTQSVSNQTLGEGRHGKRREKAELSSQHPPRVSSRPWDPLFNQCLSCIPQHGRNIARRRISVVPCARRIIPVLHRSTPDLMLIDAATETTHREKLSLSPPLPSPRAFSHVICPPGVNSRCVLATPVCDIPSSFGDVNFLFDGDL